MAPRAGPDVAFFAAPLDAGLYYQKWQALGGHRRRRVVGALACSMSQEAKRAAAHRPSCTIW